MAEKNKVKEANEAKNGDVKKQRFKKFMECFSIVCKVPPRIAASGSAVIVGLLAFWEGYGQWWFGFRPSAWVLIPIVVALNVVWLIAFCGYLSDRKKKKKIKLFSWNTLLMITLPVLVLGILLGYFTMRWRLAENKIVILVEPFVDVGQVQDGSASGKDPEGIAELVKSHLEKAIPLEKRLKVRVVLGKRHEKGSGEEIPLDQRALKYRADMVISGWYVERGEKFLVCPKFQVFRTPKPLPAAFMQSGGTYPKTIIFSRKEVENFNVNFILAKRLTYEAKLVLGAGAYASGDWKTAQQFFRTALQEIEKLESPEKESETKKSGASSIEHENLKGDEALLQLYMGHCLMNQSEFGSAIQRYDDTIEAGKKIPRGDMRYGEILASAYLARGVAYRKVNAFELARQDFETAGGHLPTSLGLRPLHTEEARFLSGDREKLVNGAEKYYNRGEKYLIQEEYKHAQAYLEMSVEFYRTLMKGMPTPIQEKHSLGLAESQVRLGEIHNRLALPELRDDENTQQAIEHLDEAVKLTRRFGNQKDPNMLKIRADSLRHLGEAYRAQDQNDVVEKALDYHEKAEKIWLELEKRENTEEQKTRIVRKAAGEQTRIGNVHRRLDDLEPKSNTNHLKNAICAYKKAINKLGGEEYLKIPYPDSTDYKVDLNEVKRVKKELKCETKKKIIIHHLAHSACTLAETHIKRSLDESAKEENERDELKIKNDIRIACELLEYAAECYRVAVKKLRDDKDKEWIKRIRDEERNLDLRDDLAWCLTLYGYALIKEGQVVDFNNPNCYYGRVTKILKEAGKCFGELRDVNQAHRVLSLFALTVSQVELDKEQEARKTFREACLLLRRLTREKKKVWYVDYVYDIMKNLPQWGFQFGTDDDSGNLEKIETWLTADTVREGRQALDKIIKSVEK